MRFVDAYRTHSRVTFVSLLQLIFIYYRLHSFICFHCVFFFFFFFFFQAEDGIRDLTVTGVQTCALPIWFPFFCQKLPLISEYMLMWKLIIFICSFSWKKFNLLIFRKR